MARDSLKQSKGRVETGSSQQNNVAAGEAQVLYLYSLEDGHDYAIFQDICVTNIHVAFVVLGKHLVICLVRFVILNFLCAPHATPTMVDKHVIFRVNVFVAIHDEASDMPKTVDPARILLKSIVTSLKNDPRNSLESLDI